MSYINKILKKTIILTADVIIFVIIAVFIIAIIFKGFNIKTYAVLSGSMEPSYHVGSLVLVKGSSYEDIKTGNTVTYRIGEDTLVTHRVVKKDDDKSQFITKGDANEVDDSMPVSYENVIGKVIFNVPFLGYVSVYEKNLINKISSLKEYDF